MNFRILLLLCCWPVILPAQILDNRRGQVFTDEDFFNEKFIRQNKIKSIRGEVAIKLELKPIKPTGRWVDYQFHPNGKLKQQLETYFRKGGKKDTAVTAFIYNEEGRLITKRKTDHGGFYSYNYTYDDKGRVIKEVYKREENALGSKDRFEVDKEYIISEESYQYRMPSDTERIKLYYNNYDKLYREVTTYYDQFGNVKEVIRRYSVTHRGSKVTFEYNDQNRLAKITEYADLSGGDPVTREFFYDKIGNLTEEKLYRKNELKSIHQFLYHETTMLLEARLTKEEATNKIRIIEYSYTFFE